MNGLHDMRPDEVALKKKLRRQDVLETIGAIVAWILFIGVAYLACLAF